MVIDGSEAHDSLLASYYAPCARLRFKLGKEDIPEVPPRVFMCTTPESEEEDASRRVGTHRDTHIGHGAVTLTLTSDTKKTSFYTSSDLNNTVK
jgi:hypothetical protein